MPAAGTRDLAKEQHWRQMFVDWRTSGLSIAAFCRSRGTVPSQFYDWKKRIDERDAEKLSAPRTEKRVRKAARARAIAATVKRVDQRAVEFAEVKVVKDIAPASEVVTEAHTAQPSRTESFVVEIVLRSGAQVRFAKNCPCDLLEAVLAVMEAR